MITLADIKNEFKTNFGWSDSISVGKIDMNAEKAICFYDSKVPRDKISAIGGKSNRSYQLKPITILLRWTKNATTAETKANEIYNYFDEKVFTKDNKRVFINAIYDGPINLGTDENGVCEYSFEFDIYSQRS